MTRLALYLLGPPRIVLDGEPLHIGRRKAVALLAYLAVTGQPHSRDTLATLLWPGYDQSTARAHLRRALATLSKRLGRDWFAAEHETIGLRHPPSANRRGELVEPSGQTPSAGSGQALWLDMAAFRQRLAACDAHDHSSEEACQGCRESLAAALALYQDDFMAGFTLPDSPAFDEWQRFQTRRLRDEVGSALVRLAACLRAVEDWEAAIANAQRWLTLDPTHEPAHRLLMELYAAAGRRGAALRQYRTCLRTLEDELGLPPSAETTALYGRIRTQGLTQRERVAAGPAPAPEARSLPAFLTTQAEPRAREQEVFVARERELAWLQEHLERALAGKGQVAFVTGGPGRGKSTLLRQFAAGALSTHDDLLVVSGSCNAVSGVGDPYLPFREVLGMLTGDVESRWAAGMITEAHARRLWAAMPLVAQGLLAHGPHLIDVLVPGASLLERARAAASDGAEWLAELQGWVERERSGSSDLEQRALFTQFTNTVSSLARRRPLLLLLDDLQWADSGSVGLLFHLGRHLADAGGRLLIVGAYRPEEVASGREGAPHPLGEVLAEFKRRFGEVWVDLAQADAMEGRRFVDAYLDSEPNRLAEGFRAALYAHTGGHPLFTVELLRALQAQGELIQDQEGAWVEGADLDWGHLPARVEGVIEARVGRLNGELRELLTVASVEGEAFTAQVVAQVLDQPERRVLRALSQELGPGGKRLVREQGEVPVEGNFLSRYQFAHALFQAYLYGMLSPGERRLLHHEVAAALEGLYGADTDGVVVPLAHHYYKAGRTEQAISYALRAGDQAYHAYANDETVLYFQRALDLLPSAGEDERIDKQRLAALSGLGRVRFRAGQLEAAERDLRAAITLGRESEMPLPDLLRLCYYLGEAQWWRGNFREMLRVGQEGLTLLGEDDESTEAALMYDTMAIAHGYLGNSGEWHKLLLRTREFLQELPYSEELRAPYVHIARLHYLDKRVEDALGWIEALKQPAARHQDLRALGSAQLFEGVGLFRQGDYLHCLSCYKQAVELFARIGDEKEVNRAYSEIAEYYLTLGDLDAAEQYTDRALAGGETVGSEMLVRGNYALLGEIALARRSWQAAREHLERAAHCRTASWGSARAIQDLGWTFLGQGDRAAALERFKDALAVAGPEILLASPELFVLVLCGIDDAYRDPVEFRAFCDRVRAEYPEFESCKLSRWYLLPAETRRDFRTMLVGFGADGEPFANLGSETKKGEWQWKDPFADGAYEVQDALIVRAANGRDLWHANLSAPRLLRSAPVLSRVEGEAKALAVQTVCGPAFDDRPGVGGLLLWQDQENYLCLSRGYRGPSQVSLSGCLGNTDMIIGRGRLTCEPDDPIFLRLERAGEQVNALCSADGEVWFSVGSATFPVAGPLHVGLHAIGMIDRSIYPGAYPDGTAIRVESFQLWGSSRQ